MTNKSWLLVATLLSACASMAPAPAVDAMAESSVGRHDVQVQRLDTRKADYCDKAKCAVDVAVDSNCGVTVTPYALVMGGEKRHEVEITWKITTGNAQFAPEEPILFKEVQGKQVFRQRSAGPGEVVFHNAGTSGIYHYAVTVVQGSRTCATLDPTGVNDM
ncbi:MAG TPA: hypothetical protein VLY46_05135 [Usitatibacter sp.]|nr:hypothetical protein [Usitatibacter sp.]